MRATDFFIPAIMYRNDKARQNLAPMDVSEARRENVRALAEQVGGAQKFADRLDRSESQISQIIGENPVRNIGNRLARTIELAFNLEPGQLDQPPDTANIRYTAIVQEIAKDLNALDPSLQKAVREFVRNLKPSE